MKNLLMSAVAALVLVGGAGAAQAGTLTTYTATGAKTITGTVTATLGSNPPISCPITINATAAANSMSVTSMSMGGLCAIASLNLLPYPVTAPTPTRAAGDPPAAATTLKIANVDATGPFGIHCAGPLTGTWNNGTSQVTFASATLPGVGGSGSCTFSGTLKMSPNTTIVNSYVP